MTKRKRPLTTCAKGILEIPPQWLVPGYIPLGSVTIVEGSGGECKSTLGIEIVAKVSCGAKVDAANKSELCKMILHS